MPVAMRNSRHYTRRMQPVDNVAHAMRLLRKQMAENLARLPGSKSGSKPGATAAKPATTLPDDVARRIKALDANDERYSDNVASVFVESVLAAEFGEALINDPQFRDLTQQVRSAMQANGELIDKLDQLADGIRRG